MCADQGLQLGDELGVAAEREVGIDPPLQDRKASRREPLQFRL